jgi:hypothetical protein
LQQKALAKEIVEVIRQQKKKEKEDKKGLASCWYPYYGWDCNSKIIKQLSKGNVQCKFINHLTTNITKLIGTILANET